MPEYHRVRLNDTGHHVTVGAVREGMTELKQPATDASGRPLPDEAPKTSAKKSAAKKTAPAAKKTVASSEETTTTPSGAAADVS